MKYKVQIKELEASYKEKKILSNVSFNIKPGSFCAIAGPNGAGKSTFLKAMIKMIQINKNSIFIDNTVIDTLTQKNMAALISMVPQNGKTNASFSVREAVQLGRYIYKDNKNVDKALETVGISNLADRSITSLSGGEFQLAMLARSVCQDAPLLALDEPINNLDLYHQLRLMRLLKELQNQGKTIICVLHDLNTILHYCSDVYLIKDGKLFSQGSPQEVLTKETIKEVFNVNSIQVDIKGTKQLIFQAV